MFKKGARVLFKGYKRPVKRGKPNMTEGKEYVVERDQFHDRYIWVRNDINQVQCYPVSSFQEVANVDSASDS